MQLGRTSFIPLGFEWHEQFDLSSRPLLELALKDSRPAYSPMVEWLTYKQTSPGVWESKVWTNYTQILRTPFNRKWLPEEDRLQTLAEAMKENGDRILDDVEKILWYGTPSRRYNGGHPLTTCGGVLHFLRRRLYENDTVSLRPLSPLTIYVSVGPDDQFKDEIDHTHEWLWEFSLQVNPGHYQRGATPLLLAPPKPEVMPKAHAEGAALTQGD